LHLQRLRGKQAPSGGWRKVKKTKTTKRCSKPRSIRAAAVAEGLVPKARRAFPLFLKQKSTAGKGATREQCRNELRRLASLWNNMTPKQKDNFRTKSATEFATQREQMRVSGLHVRAASSNLLRSERQPAADEGSLAVQSSILNLGQYKVVSQKEEAKYLGHGTFGSVLLCRGPDGRLHAAKLFKDIPGILESAKADLEHEAAMLRRIHSLTIQSGCTSTFFPTLFVAEPLRKPFPYLMLEYCGMSLATLVRRDGPFNKEKTLQVALQLKAALQWLHRHFILHLDLKPSNVMWADELCQLKVIDFGLAEVTVRQDGAEFIPLCSGYCTDPYRPPELWDVAEKDMATALAAAVDIWGWGCIVFEIFTGARLFKCLFNQEDHAAYKKTVKEWCCHWSVISRDLATHPNRMAQRLLARARKAGDFRPAVLMACNPKPEDRAYKLQGQ
jgi:hypothetical protein